MPYKSDNEIVSNLTKINAHLAQRKSTTWKKLLLSGDHGSTNENETALQVGFTGTT
jgi:hypothetical protein